MMSRDEETNRYPAADAPAQAAQEVPALKLNEDAVVFVATAMAKAHHGPYASDAGGYMDAARTIIAGGIAMREFNGSMTVEEEEPTEGKSAEATSGPLGEAEPVQVPVSGQGGSGQQSAQAGA